MSYKDLENSIKVLGFSSVEEFIKYIGFEVQDIKKWQKNDKSPQIVSLLIQSLEANIHKIDLRLDSLVDECLPLATLLDESSSFPSKLEEMFLLQKKLNDSTNGKNWELGINKFGKEINWLRCIHMEVSELIESTPWKHWKNINADADFNNIHVELVDVWHFLMSYILQETNIPKAVSLVNTHCIYEPSNNINIKLMTEESEKLSYIALAIQTGNMPSFSGVERFIDQFFKSCKVSGLSFSWLQKLYIGKNCLNKFRQEHGYKEGTYIKVWNKKEDNIVMVDFLKQSDNISLDELYIKLSEVYSNLN